MQYRILQYMDFSDPLHDIDKGLGCFCLRCSTDDKMDHTLKSERVGRKLRLPALG